MNDERRADPLNPSPSLLSKLGSIAVHAEEMLSSKGHHFDRASLEQLLIDAEVQSWLKSKEMKAFLPVKR